jgi:hypothetical protein
LLKDNTRHFLSFFVSLLEIVTNRDMANKPTPNKGAAKKIAAKVKNSPTPAKPAGKAKPVVKSPAPKAPEKSASKAKPAAKTPAKPAVKAVARPVVNPSPKPASSPAAVKKPDPAPTPSPAAAPASAPLARLLPGPKGSTTNGALTINVQTSQGSAGNGNTHAANILVIVTSGGTPVVELNRDHFTLMEHFEVPGQTACFSSNITSFRNAGTGAYLLQTRPNNGAPWRTGHHLGQLLVSSDDDRQGQAAIKLIIR